MRKSVVAMKSELYSERTHFEDLGLLILIGDDISEAIEGGS